MMDDQLFTLVFSMVAGLLTMLITVLAWIGKRVDERLNGLTDEVKSLHRTLTEFDRDLRDDIQGSKDLAMDNYHQLSERVAKVEERCDRFDKHRSATFPFHGGER